MDNNKGSSLLAQARTGSLDTNLNRSKYMENLDKNCRLCERKEESIMHVILECPLLEVHRMGRGVRHLGVNLVRYG